MEDEIWKAIPDYDGYEVSNLGQVRSYRKRIWGGWTIGDKPRLLKVYPSKIGYTEVNIYKDKKMKHIRVHKLVMLAFIGPCQKNMEVLHNDDNKSNNTLSNLRYDTHIENMKGRKSRYATREQITEMKNLYSNGMSAKNISTKFNLSPAVISALIEAKNGGETIPVKRGKSYKSKRANAIKKEFAEQKTPYKKLAEKYHLSYKSIYRIIKGRQTPT